MVGGLSLIGVPLTVGFISKWYLVQAALEQGLWIIAAIVLAGSLLALVYIWRVVEVAYFRAVPPGMAVREAPLMLLVPTWALVLASFWFGIDAGTTADVAIRAAETWSPATGLWTTMASNAVSSAVDCFIKLVHR